MADYASLKVPELKKLLQEKQLPVAGNKADLIARLQEHDKANEDPKPAAAAPVSAEEDPIDYSDDDVPTSKPEPATESAPATEKVDEPAAAPAATTETAAVAQPSATNGEEKAAETATEEAKPAETEGEAVAKEAPKTDFSANLPASIADAEAKKRAERAKRFGITEASDADADTDAKKKAARAERFGLDVSEGSLVSGLDAALPEKRERKRGREGGASNKADGERGAKRQQNTQGGRQRGGGGRDNRNNRGGRQGGRNERGPGRKDGGGGGGGGGKSRGVLDDPSERAKAEARAKRFG